MTCRHRAGDPNCSSTRRSYEEASNSKTPDKTKYTIEQAYRVGANLVLRVQYPNCKACAYEGNKVLVFLNASETDALRWREIDPHFRDPQVKRSPTSAPTPNARFPGNSAGWDDAITYAKSKTT